MDIYLSTGTNFSLISGPIIHVGNTEEAASADLLRIRLGDFNGDGKTDIVAIWGWGSWEPIRVHLSTGNGFNVVLGPTVWVAGDLTNAVGDLLRVNIWDFNGDGMSDIGVIEGWGTPTGNIRAHYSSGQVPDLLNSITNHLGGTTTITYEPSSSYENDVLPFVVQTVSSIAVDDNNGHVSTTNYWYGGGFYKASEREFRGFDYVWSQSADPAGATTETWFATGFHPEEEIYKGMPTVQVISDVPGNVYAGTINSYGNTTPYTGVNFPYLSAKDDYIFDKTTTRDEVYNGSWSSKPYKDTSVEFYYDAYGNLVRKHSLGDVHVPDDQRDEYIEYNYDTSKWILSLPVHTYMNDSNSTKKAEAWFAYDANGNLLQKTAWNDSGANPSVYYGYDAYGNQNYIRDARGNASTIGYDSTFTYPVTMTNALGQIATTTYDYKFGKPLVKTDPNGIPGVTYQYDKFGRLLSETNPVNGSPAYAWTEKYYDGLGRTIMTKAAGPGGKVIVTETKYNALGQVFQTSLPYFTNLQGTLLETPRWTTYEYDAVGRGTKVTNPDGTSIMKKYYQGRTTLVDANGHQRIEEKDIYGRLIKVEEYTGIYPNASLYATTTYEYSVLGNLSKVTDAKGNQTTINYDSLSRKINMSDPDMGYWTYQYDENGNLIHQTDAKGQNIYFRYDEINRIRQKDYVTQKALDSGDVVYKYDEAWSTYPKGRLTTVTDTSGSEKYYYDKLGRATTAIKTVDGSSYQVDKVYDSLGRVISIRYPDNETVTYDYDEGGNLTGVSNYATFSNFNALGQAGTITYANGVTTTQQYSSTNNRLSSIITNSPTAGGLQNLSYLYDYAGNISTLTDYVDSSRTQTFTYDELNRLRFATSASYSPANTLEYQYDKIGNMTFNTRVGNYTYGTKPHAVLQAGANFYSYDPNGSMTGKTGQTGLTITYDFDNRASNMQGSNGSVVNVYDYSGQRVKKNGTVYIGKLFECTGGTCVKYIFAGSQRIASQSTTKTYFYHTDHLGSASIVTDERGNKAQETYYYPFGETRYNSGSATHYKFTGQEEDPETGLYYYGARYYDPVLGRYISPDSIVQAPFDPQTLNRYSYCDNNPIIYTDPSGHFAFLPILIGAIMGAVISGAQSHWNMQAMLIGAFIGGVSGGAYSGVEGAVAGAIKSAVTNATLAGAISGAAGGAVAGATAGGLGAAIYGGNIGQGMLRGAGLGAAGGAAFGAIGGYFGKLWNLYRVGAYSLAGGGISELAGQGFGKGAILAGASAFGRFMYNEIVGYDTDWSPGGEAREKERLTMPYEGANNVGVQGGPVDPNGVFNEGGVISRGANNIPGINAVAGMHDAFQVKLDEFISKPFGEAAGDFMRSALNVPAMMPAAVLTYGSLMVDPRALILYSVDNRRN